MLFTPSARRLTFTPRRYRATWAPLAPVLAGMRAAGVRLDLEHLAAQEARAREHLQDLAAQCARAGQLGQRT